MAEGRVLHGVEIPEDAPIQRCRSCGAPIWWGVTAGGRRCPFDVHLAETSWTRGAAERTAITHFSTCPDARGWSKHG